MSIGLAPKNSIFEVQILFWGSGPFTESGRKYPFSCLISTKLASYLDFPKLLTVIEDYWVRARIGRFSDFFALVPNFCQQGVCFPPMRDNHFTLWTHHNISFSFRVNAIWAGSPFFLLKIFTQPHCTAGLCLLLTARACFALESYWLSRFARGLDNDNYRMVIIIIITIIITGRTIPTWAAACSAALTLAQRLLRTETKGSEQSPCRYYHFRSHPPFPFNNY